MTHLHVLLVMVVSVVDTGCAAPKLLGLKVTPRCADGLPPLLLIHEACPPDGICGYSCVPGRWEDCEP